MPFSTESEKKGPTNQAERNTSGIYHLLEATQPASVIIRSAISHHSVTHIICKIIVEMILCRSRTFDLRRAVGKQTKFGGPSSSPIPLIIKVDKFTGFGEEDAK